MGDVRRIVGDARARWVLAVLELTRPRKVWHMGQGGRILAGSSDSVSPDPTSERNKTGITSDATAAVVLHTPLCGGIDDCVRK